MNDSIYSYDWSDRDPRDMVRLPWASLLFSAALVMLPAAPASAFVTDPGDPPPENCLSQVSATRFRALPANIALGQATTLSWSISAPSNCSGLLFYVDAQRVFGNSGTLQRSPTANATYTLRAIRYGTTLDLATASVSVDRLAYSEANTPICSPEQIIAHNGIRNGQHAVDVTNPTGHFIGPYEAQGDLWRDWEPIDQYKHVLCGTLHRYGFFIGPWIADGDEADSNMHIVPSDRFRFLIDDAISLGYVPPGAVNKCGFIQCLEAEITPDENDVNNPWFPPYEGATSPLVGQSMCAYGPWIADHGHDGVPEIHPSEARWWPTLPTPDGVLTETRVQLAQDDSNRYDRYYQFLPEMPLNIKPWSAPPMTADIRYAFLVQQNGGQEQFLHVWPEAFRNVSPIYPDVSENSSTRHTLKFNGVPKFTIVEQLPGFENNLGVGFDDNYAQPSPQDVCRRPDGMLQGYALLRSQYGVNDRGGEGYQRLRLRHTLSSNDNINPESSAQQGKLLNDPARSRLLGGRLDPSSIRLTQVAGRMLITGDLIIKLRPEVALSGVATSGGKHVALKPVVASKNMDNVQMRLVGVDLATGSELIATFADGASASSQQLGLGIAVELQPSPVRADAASADLDAAWAMILSENSISTRARPPEFSYFSNWSLGATLQFAARKEGRIAHEEESPLARLLNRNTERGQYPDMPTLADAIVSIRWEGTDRASKGSRDHQLSRKVSFVSPANVTSRRMALEIHDVFGGVTTADATAESHGFMIDNTSRLRAIVAQLSDTTEQTIKAPSALESAKMHLSTLPSERGKLAQLLVRSIRDGVVTPSELKTQLTLAKRIAAQSADEREPVISATHEAEKHLQRQE